MSFAKRNIVWLSSYPKSGNTWFRIFLNNLLSDSSESVDINNLSKIPISSSRNIIDSIAGLDSSDLSHAEISILQPNVYRMISSESDQLLFFKTHEAWSLNLEGDEIYPREVTKGVIYIIRNPLDVAISYSFHNNNRLSKTIVDMNQLDFKLCSNEKELKTQIPQYLSSWSNHVISWIDKSKLPVHIMRYEDMLRDTTLSFTEALDFLDLKFPQKIVEIAIQNSSFQFLRQQEKKHGFRERSIHSNSFFRKGISNEWKSVLLESQKDEIIDHHSQIMRRFDYL